MVVSPRCWRAGCKGGVRGLWSSIVNSLCSDCALSSFGFVIPVLAPCGERWRETDHIPLALTRLVLESCSGSYH